MPRALRIAGQAIADVLLDPSVICVAACYFVIRAACVIQPFIRFLASL